MSQPGEKVEVVFTAPEETGEYGYVCTFPGHWATMTGTMRVTDSPA
jgi:azurin